MQCRHWRPQQKAASPMRPSAMLVWWSRHVILARHTYCFLHCSLSPSKKQTIPPSDLGTRGLREQGDAVCELQTRTMRIRDCACDTRSSETHLQVTQRRPFCDTPPCRASSARRLSVTKHQTSVRLGCPTWHRTIQVRLGGPTSQFQVLS